MPSWNLNPYGLRNGQIISADDLNEDTEYGLRCNCTCPACGEPLEARIRVTKKVKHFAHKSGADCGKGYESALHRLAKQVIEEGVEIMLPSITSTYGEKGFFVIDRIVRFPASYQSTKPIIPDEGETMIEKDMGSFRPDVSIKNHGTELFIEIQVTHPVDNEKKKLIQDTGISCVEFDFSYYKDQIIEESDIRKALEGKDENVEIRWIYNKVVEEHDAIIKAHQKDCLIYDSFIDKPKPEAPIAEIGFQHEIINKNISNCPLRKHLDGSKYYAKNEECKKCMYFSGFLYALDSEEPFSILCQKGDNNIIIRPQDAVNWLIYSSNERYIPKTEAECKELIESLVEKLGNLSTNSQIQDAKEQATKILISRYKGKKERELKEERDRKFKNLYSRIYRSLNSLIFWANSSYDVWSKYAYKEVLNDLPDFLLQGFSREEVDSTIYKLARKVWDSHCKAGENLFNKENKQFRSLICSFLSQPVNEKEQLRDWLYRVTFSLLQYNKGVYRFAVPLWLVEDRLTQISILPFLEKVARAKYFMPSNLS